MSFTKEQLAKAKTAKSAEELFEMAKAENIEMTIEDAKKYFNALNSQGELSDEELDAVAGGKGAPEPKYVVGNIVIETGKSTFNAYTYEILSVNEYSEMAKSWQYTCLCLEENYTVCKTFDSNPNAYLLYWSK